MLTEQQILEADFTAYMDNGERYFHKSIRDKNGICYLISIIETDCPASTSEPLEKVKKIYWPKGYFKKRIHKTDQYVSVNMLIHLTDISIKQVMKFYADIWKTGIFEYDERY